MKIRNIDKLARPLGGVYHVFRLMPVMVRVAEKDEDTDTFETRLVFQRGQKCMNVHRDFFGLSPAVSKLLMMDPSFAAAYEKYKAPGSCIDTTCPYFPQHTAEVLRSMRIHHLNGDGSECCYMYLRGSEVSLDRMVLLSDSPPASPTI